MLFIENLLQKFYRIIDATIKKFNYQNFSLLKALPKLELINRVKREIEGDASKFHSVGFLKWEPCASNSSQALLHGNLKKQIIQRNGRRETQSKEKMKRCKVVLLTLFLFFI